MPAGLGPVRISGENWGSYMGIKIHELTILVYIGYRWYKGFDP